MLLSQTLPASERKKWEKVALALRELGNQGQSSEDSDEESIDHRLNVTVPFFRRRILGVVFQELDETVKSLEKQQAKETGKRFQPRPSLPRYRTDIKSHRTVVKGLPRSFYHRRYIRHLHGSALQSLEIKGSAGADPRSLDPWAQTLQTDSDTEGEQ